MQLQLLLSLDRTTSPDSLSRFVPNDSAKDTSDNRTYRTSNRCTQCPAANKTDRSAQLPIRFGGRRKLCPT
uniref:Uncharacterized protein n=1 Tax=Candidatus Kentrum sp. LPFa TaxID=2126335 RepID=A0A450WF16_9GAMM|nr:MAG: hypothetical protein BECKLPF1236B_GA0070989_108115 [Candidatus Kentron sp. LPFa]